MYSACKLNITHPPKISSSLDEHRMAKTVRPQLRSNKTTFHLLVPGLPLGLCSLIPLRIQQNIKKSPELMELRFQRHDWETGLCRFRWIPKPQWYSNFHHYQQYWWMQEYFHSVDSDYHAETVEEIKSRQSVSLLVLYPVIMFSRAFASYHVSGSLKSHPAVKH